MNKTNIILLITLTLVLTACANNPNNNTADNKPVQIANPASKFCIDNGGTLDIRTASDGSQTGYCKFSTGNECEEWAFMRGECKQTHVCTTEEKANKACTREYMPVCGSDDKTYANKCTACSEGIDSWTPEACTINYSISEVLNESCQTDQDCETPMNYLLRSSCPYTTKCLDEKCNVVCPIYTNGKYPDVKECGTCPQYSAPSPDFCKNGRIVDNGKDECSCQKTPTCENVACTMEAKMCSDGITYVGRTGPNCEFELCPNEVNTSKTHYCTAEEKAAEICTMDYNPVCGDDNITYGNGCGACTAKVDYWKSGECV